MLNLKYDENQIYIIKNIYIIFILIWFIIIYTLKLYVSDLVIILLIPIIFFLIGFFNSDHFDDHTSDNFEPTFIGLGLVIIISMLGYMDKSSKDLTKLYELLLLAMVLILITYYHIWIPANYNYVWKHIKSCLVNMAVTLFIYVLISYYIIHKKK